MTSTLPRNELTEWRWLQHLARERRHRHLREYARDAGPGRCYWICRANGWTCRWCKD